MNNSLVRKFIKSVGEHLVAIHLHDKLVGLFGSGAGFFAGLAFGDAVVGCLFLLGGGAVCLGVALLVRQWREKCPLSPAASTAIAPQVDGSVPPKGLVSYRTRKITDEYEKRTRTETVTEATGLQEGAVAKRVRTAIEVRPLHLTLKEQEDWGSGI